MAKWNGIVTNVKNGGTVDVIIGPSQQSIPHAPESINQRVCHCSSDSSSVIITAIDRVGAHVGDYVSVSRSTSIIIKNLIFFIGLPVAGLALGLITHLVAGVSSHMGYIILSAALSLMAGSSIGIYLYKKTSHEDPFVLNEIISRAGDEMKMVSSGGFSCIPGSEYCNSCSIPGMLSRYSK